MSPKYAVGGLVRVYNIDATTRQGLRKGADNKVLSGETFSQLDRPLQNRRCRSLPSG